MRFYRECSEAGLGPDDLAQETILRAEKNWDRLPARESDLQRYIHRIMANLIKDQLEAARAQKRGGGKVVSLDLMLNGMAESTLRLEMLIPAKGPGPRTLAQRREARRLIMAALEKLPEDQQSAVTLHLVHEFSLVETAEAMGRSEGQVRGYLQRGRATLQDELRELWDGG